MPVKGQSASQSVLLATHLNAVSHSNKICSLNYSPFKIACDCPRGDLRNVPPILPQRCTENGDCFCPDSADGSKYVPTDRGCKLLSELTDSKLR